jgi:hypothetical protein
VDRNVRLAGMVRAMIQVAQSQDMIPLAEGIETEGECVSRGNLSGIPRPERDGGETPRRRTRLTNRPDRAIAGS